MQIEFGPEVSREMQSERGPIPTADRPSGCLLFRQMAHTRSSSEDREDADTSSVQRLISL